MDWINENDLVWSFKKDYLKAWDIMKNHTKILSTEVGFKYFDWSDMFNNTSETIFLDLVHFQRKEDKGNIANTVLIDSLKNILTQ